jgi:Tol biopolymer transport system component
VQPDGAAGEPLNAGVSPGWVVVDGKGQTWLMGNTGSELRVQRFDTARETLLGPSISIVNGISGGPIWSTSNNGVLVYRRAQKQTHRLVVRGPDGKISRELTDAASNATLRISPDGKRVAFLREYGSERGIWVLDVAGGAPARLTFGKGDAAPVWSPDGKKIYYSFSKGNGEYAVVERAGEASSAERTVFSDSRRFYPTSVSPDGRYLLLNAPAGGSSSAFAVPVGGGRPERILGDIAPNPGFSPDGRWVVFEVRRGMTNTDVIARATPQAAGGEGGEAAVQISTAGGYEPVWRGKNIFYIAPDGKVMRVAVETGETLRVGTPEALFDTGRPDEGPTHPTRYDVSRDGKWSLWRDDVNVGREPPLTVVLNWENLLK